MSKKAGEAVEEPGAKKGGLKKIIIISLVLLVVIALGVVGAIIFHARSSDASADHEEQAAEAKHDEKPPVYEKLEVFTVNLSGGGNYLQTEIALKIADPAVGEKIKARMPEIRNAIIELLSSKTQDELATVQGKQKLADQIQVQVNGLLGAKKPDEGTSKVLFSTFIIQ